jgi:hypothetical protein
MEWLSIIVLGLILLFGLTAFYGAPYVPTHRKQVEVALDLLSDHLRKGDTVLDLGSGDGVFVLAAAKRGFRAIGYEINPLLCIIAWCRCWRYRSLASIKLRDFWLTPSPHVKAIFMFGGGPFMKRLGRKLSAERATRTEPLFVVSYGFPIPGYESSQIEMRSGMRLYRLDAGRA